MSRLFKEPLFHFLVLGALIFAANSFLADRTVQAGAGDIVVTQGRIENLAALYNKTWQRPPTAEELKGLVDDYVLEEVLVREGITLGVDQDDTVIRRRIRQKMEFVVDDVVDLRQPTDGELETWLRDHAQSYARPARHTFRQVYLNPNRRGDALESDAAATLEQLRSNRDLDPRELGDGSLLEHAFQDTTTDLVARTFGQDFADDLAHQPVGEWSGPIGSAYGLHLVLIDARHEGELPPLTEVRDAVARDWSYAEQERASRAFYDELLTRYEVRIDWPDPSSPTNDGSAQGSK